MNKNNNTNNSSKDRTSKIPLKKLTTRPSISAQSQSIIEGTTANEEEILSLKASTNHSNSLILEGGTKEGQQQNSNTIVVIYPPLPDLPSPINEKINRKKVFYNNIDHSSKGFELNKNDKIKNKEDDEEDVLSQLFSEFSFYSGNQNDILTFNIDNLNSEDQKIVERVVEICGQWDIIKWIQARDKYGILQNDGLLQRLSDISKAKSTERIRELQRLSDISKAKSTERIRELEESLRQSKAQDLERIRELEESKLLTKRSSFLQLLRSKNLRNCEQLFKEIDDLKLQLKDLSPPRGNVAPHTNDIIFYQDDCNTTVTEENKIRLSDFRIDMLYQELNKPKTLVIKKMNLSKEEMIAAIKEANNPTEDPEFETKFKDFIEIEVKNVKKISSVCDYYKFVKIDDSFGENDLQLLFILYAHYLCNIFHNFVLKLSQNSNKKVSSSIGKKLKKFGAYAITQVKLKAEVNVFDVNGEKKKVSVVGNSDVCLAHTTTKLSNENKRSYVTNNASTVIVELKRYGGDLDAHTSDSMKCSHQLFGQLMVLSDMRKHLLRRVVKSLLTDFKSFRVACSVRDQYNSFVYLVSSMFVGEELLLLGILFLISDVSESNSCFDTVREEFVVPVLGNCKENNKKSESDNQKPNNNKRSKNITKNLFGNNENNQNSKLPGNSRSVLQSLDQNISKSTTKQFVKEEKLEVIKIRDSNEVIRARRIKQQMQDFDIARLEAEGFSYLSAEALSKLR